MSPIREVIMKVLAKNGKILRIAGSLLRVSHEAPDPIRTVTVTLSLSDETLNVSADGDLSTFDHFSIEFSAEQTVVKTIETEQSAVPLKNLGIPSGTYAITAEAVSSSGERSTASDPVTFRYDDPYNPLGLKPYTIRVEMRSGTIPYFGDEQVQISETPNVWDVTKSSADWSYLLNSNVVRILGANSTGVTSMWNMCQGNRNLISVALFDTSSVTNFKRMFMNCTRLTSVPAFDLSSATTTESMFAGCSAITEFPDFDTRNCKYMSAMFDSCDSMTVAPNLDCSSCEEMISLLSGCSSLVSVPLYDTRNVTTMANMFWGDTALKEAPLFDTRSVTTMQSMFHNCWALEEVPEYDLTSVTNMNGMFYGCTKVERGALDLYRRARSKSPVPSHASTFRDCGSDTPTGRAELAAIPSDWK